MPSTAVLAPVTGKIGEIRVAEGQAVSAGSIVIVEHAAKTENNIAAPVSGRIRLLVQQGAQVAQGERLAEIDA